MTQARGCKQRFKSDLLRNYLVPFLFSSPFFFPMPCIIFALLFSLPPSLDSDPGSYGRLFSPPTHYGSCLALLSREDFSSFFPRRLASNYAYPRQALIRFTCNIFTMRQGRGSEATEAVFCLQAKKLFIAGRTSIGCQK